MKKLFYLIIVILLLVAGFFLLNSEKKEDNSLTTEKYSRPDVGLEFTYRTGSQGYVLDERIPADIGELVRVLILQRSEDLENELPVGGEGYPVITIAVLRNTMRQQARAWAEDNIEYSNINLLSGTVEETVIGGANAIRYMADGLYASENVVVAHGENIYVISGQFLEEDSDIRRDFGSLVESINFIPEPGQI